MATIANLSFYLFFELKNPDELKPKLLTLCNDLGFKGTILLAHEGLNASLAGPKENTNALRHSLAQIIPEINSSLVKESFSDFIPFAEMLVKIKREIVTMGIPEINPLQIKAPYVSPETLKDWIDQDKDFLLIDTRNDYEFQLGTFENAEHLTLENFRQFPEQIETLRQKQGNRPIVTFCTGGIRCEKAAPFLVSQGLSHVYQLEGGILNYFEECGGAHYKGECFVFDNRIALDTSLNVSGAFLCQECQFPMKAGTAACSHCKTPVAR